MARPLEDFSADDLLFELRAREEGARGGEEEPPDVAETDEDGQELNPELESYDAQKLSRALRDTQEVIYGVDDRVDLFEVTEAALLEDADSLVALFDAGDVTDNGDGSSTLATSNFGTSRNLCAGEPFRDQPIGAFCSRFLVAPDLVATAGHCVDPPNTPAVEDIRFVFGFRMVDSATGPPPIPSGEIFSGAQVVGRQLDQSGSDWCLVRLDRPVTNHRPAPIRRRRRIGSSANLHVIGHPVGLPAKLAAGAAVRDNTPSPFFVANLDTYGGNSGSPVFNSRTHVVEGILVRGERDFVRSGNCNVSFVCPTTGCRGEDVTRITRRAQSLVRGAFRRRDARIERLRGPGLVPGSRRDRLRRLLAGFGLLRRAREDVEDQFSRRRPRRHDRPAARRRCDRRATCRGVSQRALRRARGPEGNPVQLWEPNAASIARDPG